jgi:hypothetical protein
VHRYKDRRDIRFANDGQSWTQLTKLSDEGAILVRPDGYVAARLDPHSANSMCKM